MWSYRFIPAVALMAGAPAFLQGYSPASQPAGAAVPATLPSSAAIVSSQPSPEDAREAELRRQAELRVVEQFIDHLKGSASIEPSARTAVLQMWNNRQADDDPRAMMTTAMAIISKPYKSAMDAIDNGQFAIAGEMLKPQLDNPDLYISAHTTALMARALVEDDRTEEAQKVLECLSPRRDEIAARTFLGPEMQFMLGYSQLSNLHYEDALATLTQFERQFPDAPDQYRLPARQVLQELAGRRADGLGDVSDLMSYAGRQLKHARTDQVVRGRQDRAVDLLTKLVEEAEDRENQAQQQGGACKQCGGKGCSKCRGGRPQGNQPPQRGAERSMLPGGQGRVGNLHQSARARPGEEWGKMRPEEREKVLQALRQSFPSRYRQLVEQYYKQLAKEQ